MVLVAGSHMDCELLTRDIRTHQQLPIQKAFHNVPNALLSPLAGQGYLT